MKLVLIEWQDSFGCSTDWQPLDGVRAAPLICKSVGWLAYDGDDCKVIVPHVSTAHNHAAQQGCGDMTIPTKAILKVQNLRRASAH